MPSATRNAALALAVLLPGAAYAQDNAAVDPAAKAISDKCSQATETTFRRAQVAVDPQGNEAYGLAIVYGLSKTVKGPAAVICLVDRKTGEVQLGSALTPDIVRVARPLTPEQQEKLKARRAALKAQKESKQQGATGGTGDDAQDDQP